MRMMFFLPGGGPQSSEKGHCLGARTERRSFAGPVSFHWVVWLTGRVVAPSKSLQVHRTAMTSASAGVFSFSACPK
jgi:hypothetical protein